VKTFVPLWPAIPGAIADKYAAATNPTDIPESNLAELIINGDSSGTEIDPMVSTASNMIDDAQRIAAKPAKKGGAK